jgi:fluoride exporter
MVYVAISVGAVLGANVRYLLGGWINDRFGSAFPYGTLVINVTGSIVIGFLMILITEKIVAPDWFRPMLIIGFLGSYTTFSTFSYETIALAREGSYVAAAVNVIASVGISLVGVLIGAAAARAI